MTKKTVALVGLDPFTLDFSDPAYAPFANLGAEKVQAGLDHDVNELNRLGYDAHLVLTEGDLDTARRKVSAALKSKAWDCVMIGAGVRTIAKNFGLFETFVNLAHELAPQAKICFNTRPDDTAATVQRWIQPHG